MGTSHRMAAEKRMKLKGYLWLLLKLLPYNSGKIQEDETKVLWVTTGDPKRHSTKSWASRRGLVALSILAGGSPGNRHGFPQLRWRTEQLDGVVLRVWVTWECYGAVRDRVDQYGYFNG